MAFMLRDFDLPENIFYFHNNDLHPLSFVLDWDSKDKFYFNLLNKFFADVFHEPNKHSMVLVKPGETTYFHKQIPAFDIRYIEDCFKLKDYPNPNQYVVKNSCPVKYSTNDIYACWYHKTKSWLELTPISESDDDQSDQNQLKKVPCLPRKMYDHTLSSEVDEGNESTSTKISCGTLHSTKSWKKNTRLPYSHKEDIAIVKFIIKHKYAFNITGREMWQKMEQSNVCKIRSWQSMKERYLKHIKWDLNSKSIKFSFLSPQDLKLLRQGLNIDAIKPQEKEELKSKLQEEHIDDWSSDDI